MLGLFNETTKLTVTNAAQSWTPPGQPVANAGQSLSWQAVYQIVSDQPIHVLRVNDSNEGAEVTTATGARIVADWPDQFVVDFGDQLSLIRGNDATADANVYISRVANK